MSARTVIGSPRFALGQVVGTPGALELLERFGINPSDLLRRHQRGDWGDLDACDQGLNDEALRDGSRLLSNYRLDPAEDSSECVWIITEACDDDGRRRCTTILRPEDY